MVIFPKLEGEPAHKQNYLLVLCELFVVLLCSHEDDPTGNVNDEEDYIAKSLTTIITNLTGSDGRIKDYPSQEVRA